MSTRKVAGPPTGPATNETAAVTRSSRCDGTPQRRREPAGGDAERRWWYDLGFRTGWEIGYRHAQWEQTREWIESRGGGPRLSDDPSLAELRRRRAEAPEDTNCPCPACSIRRDAVRWNIRRYGQSDYPGQAAAS